MVLWDIALGNRSRDMTYAYGDDGVRLTYFCVDLNPLVT